jgi:hypothetical protein
MLVDAFTLPGRSITLAVLIAVLLAIFVMHNFWVEIEVE